MSAPPETHKVAIAFLGGISLTNNGQKIKSSADIQRESNKKAKKRAGSLMTASTNDMNTTSTQGIG